MVIFGWIVWGIACVFLLSFILAALYQRDLGLRAHHWRHCLLLALGLTITIVTHISKLHLIWWVPVTFGINQMLSMIIMSSRIKRGTREFEKHQRNKFQS